MCRRVICTERQCVKERILWRQLQCKAAAHALPIRGLAVLGRHGPGKRRPSAGLRRRGECLWGATPPRDGFWRGPEPDRWMYFLKLFCYLDCSRDLPRAPGGVVEPVTSVANCSYPGSVQASHSFCMKIAYVSKDLQKGLGALLYSMPLT